VALAVVAKRRFLAFSTRWSFFPLAGSSSQIN